MSAFVQFSIKVSSFSVVAVQTQQIFFVDNLMLGLPTFQHYALVMLREKQITKMMAIFVGNLYRHGLCVHAV